MVTFDYTPVIAVEQKIYSLDHEESYGWNLSSQKLVGHEVGDHEHVSWTRSESIQVFGGVHTHNHPRPGYPAPSWMDLFFMQTCQLYEMRVCSKDPYLYHKIAHRVCQRTVPVLLLFTRQHYDEIMIGVYKKHRLPYITTDHGVFPSVGYIKIAIDALDEGLTLLGKEWGFSYRMWTD